jgi:hypothetical protein
MKPNVENGRKKKKPRSVYVSLQSALISANILLNIQMDLKYGALRGQKKSGACLAVLI